jgi:TRAP-type C4-dicarboxylate transport system substrate-binding protein
MSLALAVALAAADLVTLRMAAIAPDGASWTRELKSFARDIETRTHGRVRMKWYWGAIAGDELSVLDRIRRDQLDGEAGVQHCQKLSPSMRIGRLLGLIQSYDEAGYVFGRLHAELDKEFRAAGFWVFVSGMGSEVLFTREPVRSLIDLKRARLWSWDTDEVMKRQMQALGARLVPGTVSEAFADYESNRIDAIQAIPTAALAYQWSSRARYYTDLKLGFLPACMIVANRVFDTLSIADQQTIREAAARLDVRFRDLGATQDRELLETLFPRQGLQHIRPDETFRAEFFSAVREARKAIPADLISPDLIRKVESWLADYRAEHR